MVQCVLIDPKAQTVTMAECDMHANNGIATLLGCSYVESTRLPNEDFLLLDEEGLVGQDRGQSFFLWAGANQPFVGRGAVFAQAGGELVAPRSTVEVVRAAVRFITPDVARTLLARRGNPFGG